MTKRSYYKETQTVLKYYKVAGYTTVKLNASREVLDESLRAIVNLHPNLDWETVFFYPETALEILKTVQIEETPEETPEDKSMTTQTEPTKLKWHKAQHGGDWEAKYIKPWAVNSYDNKTCTVTILKDDGLWKFCSSEEWENSDTDDVDGFKTLREAKAAAQEATDSDFWSSSEDEEDPSPDYLDFKAKTIAMKQEYVDGLAA